MNISGFNKNVFQKTKYANWAINVRLSVNHLSSTCAGNLSLSNSLIIKTIKAGRKKHRDTKKINVAKLILFNFFSRLQMCGQAGTIKIVWLSTCGFQRPLGLAVHCWATRDNQENLQSQRMAVRELCFAAGRPRYIGVGT